MWPHQQESGHVLLNLISPGDATDGVIPWLSPGDDFPPLTRALREPSGLLAAGGDLSTDTLLRAYRQGIFPWFGDHDPILWWSPDPRMVLFLEELHVSRSMRKTLRGGQFEVTADRDFLHVIKGCRKPRNGIGGTWITEQMVEAYLELHRAGYAHSIETWIGGELAGGLYGVSIGRVFFGESMFTRVTNASKIALVYLAQQLHAWQFGMIDCQMRTEHLAAFGAREIPRAEFAQLLADLIDYGPAPGPWKLSVDAGV
ncbi:MAG: leucyl/phenylalanyl-tRNA--protein transferase [Betaproteobacteria bacterium]|nr:MAG: leucyl/phenylalanyl-tRNA--protein transferase [Betaproteobacteria bacterium]